MEPALDQAWNPDQGGSPRLPSAPDQATSGPVTDAVDPAGLVGASARLELQVTDADTAQALGSGEVSVLGTPRVLALTEAASVAATSGRLGAGLVTVGTRVTLEHLIPTPVGRTVVATAVVRGVDGRRLVFDVQLTDGDTVAARGTLERAVVDRSRFLQRAFGG